MRVSLLSFNKPTLTIDCLQRLLAHVPAESITLTHNGSKPEIVSDLQTQFPQIEHHILSENSGFTGGANAALKNAFKKSDWVFFITNDCLLETSLRTPQKPGLYAPKILRRKTNLIDSLGADFQPLTGRLRHHRNKKDAVKSLSKKWAQSWRGYFYVPGTAFYIHKSIPEKIGGFDESLHTYWEDVDYSVRAQKAGLTLSLAEETVLRHKIGKTCHKDPFYTQTLFQRNRRIISRRHQPSWLPPLLLLN